MASAVVNKIPYDYADIEIDLGDLGIYTGITEINYSDSVERERLYGTSRLPQDETDGVYEAEGDVTMHKSESIRFIKALGERAAQLGLSGYYKVPFAVSVKFGHAAEAIETEVLENCKLQNTDSGHSQGPDKLEVGHELWIRKIKRYGLEPI
jgi:hypothetical protein